MGLAFLACLAVLLLLMRLINATTVFDAIVYTTESCSSTALVAATSKASKANLTTSRTASVSSGACQLNSNTLFNFHYQQFNNYRGSSGFQQRDEHKPQQHRGEREHWNPISGEHSQPTTPSHHSIYITLSTPPPPPSTTSTTITWVTARQTTAPPPPPPPTTSNLPGCWQPVHTFPWCWWKKKKKWSGAAMKPSEFRRSRYR